MSQVRRRWMVGFLAMLSTLGSAGIAAAQGEPEEVLQKRGLRKVGKYYVLESEKDFADGWARIRPAYLQMEAAFNELAQTIQAEHYARDLDDQLIGIGTTINQLNIQIGGSRGGQRQYLQGLLKQARLNQSAVRGELALVRKRVAGPAKKRALQNTFNQRKNDFKAAVAELDPVYQKLKQNYADLKQADDVKNALRVLRERTKVQLLLGPSEVIQKDVAILNRALEMTSDDPGAFRRTKKKTRLPDNPKAPSDSTSSASKGAS